jgi:hypothetical protein
MLKCRNLKKTELLQAISELSNLKVLLCTGASRSLPPHPVPLFLQSHHIKQIGMYCTWILLYTKYLHYFKLS